MRRATSHKSTTVICFVLILSMASWSQTCSGKPIPNIKGTLRLTELDDGSLVSLGRLEIDLDGNAHAYHAGNAKAGALIHLCNAGKVYLPDGSSYQGSESRATCTGRFMDDFARIGKAGWNDPTVGAINWYGILGTGETKIHGTTIHDTTPVLQPDHSGFFVSPTSLTDQSITDPKDQAAYVDPLRVPFAVVPRSLVDLGIAMGTYGVAIDPQKRIAASFVVADGGPRVGEGSPVLAHQISGLPLPQKYTRAEASKGQIDSARLVWVFFAGKPQPYDHHRPDLLGQNAQAAFLRWGGPPRLNACLVQATSH